MISFKFCTNHAIANKKAQVLMKELTKAEEQVMHILWKQKKGFVKDLMEFFPNPKPAYNTVSTIIRILEKKGFVSYKAYGKTHEYFPLVTKRQYTKSFFKGFMKNYFSNSFEQLVSFFSKENDLTTAELEEMMKILEQKLEEKKASENDL